MLVRETSESRCESCLRDQFSHFSFYRGYRLRAGRRHGMARIRVRVPVAPPISLSGAGCDSPHTPFGVERSRAIRTCPTNFCSPVAQSAGHLPLKQEVGGATPPRAAVTSSCFMRG